MPHAAIRSATIATVARVAPEVDPQGRIRVRLKLDVAARPPTTTAMDEGDEEAPPSRRQTDSKGEHFHVSSGRSEKPIPLP